jgi:IclR family acetate operon transcriptional repressor
VAAEAIVGRCLDTLELLSLEPRGLPLTEIAQRLHLMKSGTHRLLTELQDEGYITQDATSQHYRLSMRFPALGFQYLTGTGILDAAMPHLRVLADETGEFVRMTVADATALTWVAKAQGAKTRLRFEPEMGSDVQLPNTASGKAWLSSMTDAAAVRLVRSSGFALPSGRSTASSPSEKEFLRHLHATRERGYGLSVDESEPGMSAVAVNIVSSKSAPVVLGTVSVAGPTMRVDMTRLIAYVEPLRRAAAKLSSAWPRPA